VDDDDGIVVGWAPSTLGHEYDRDAWTHTLTTGAKGQEGLEGLYYLALFMSASAAFANVWGRDVG